MRCGSDGLRSNEHKARDRAGGGTHPARDRDESVHDGVLLYGGDKSRAASATEGATLTLHFCDEVFASGARNRASRVSTPGQMFGLRMSPRDAHPSQSSKRQPPKPATAFWTADLLDMALRLVICARRARLRPSPSPSMGHEDWLCARRLTARLGSVMRYRSATVAGFHGLPCLSG